MYIAICTLKLIYSYWFILFQLTFAVFYVHTYIGRIMVVNMLIFLIILTSQCTCVHSKVIIINSNNGNDNIECCVNGECPCSSLSTALLNIDNNTIINITSELVALNNTATMGSGKLTNITIIGSNVTIMCNNSGGVYCESCDNVMIDGITWDKCGDPNYKPDVAGVTFNGTSNISLLNCTFQYSQVPVITLLGISDSILIQGCNFLSNIPFQLVNNSCGILSITRSSSSSSEFSHDSNITIAIVEGHFYNNGYLKNISDSPAITPVLSLYIDIDDKSVLNCNITLKNTKFISNRNTAYIITRIFKLTDILLTELLLINNVYLHSYAGAGIDIRTRSHSNDVVLSIISSLFNANEGISMYCSLTGNNVSVTVSNSNFTNSRLAVDANVGSVEISTEANDRSEITFYGVQVNNNLIDHPLIGVIYDTAGAISIITTSGDLYVNISMTNVASTQYLGRDGGALYIFFVGDGNSNCYVLLKKCEFVSNQSPGHGAASYFSLVNFHVASIEMEDTSFDHNKAGSSIVYVTQHGFERNNNIELNLNNSVFTNNAASAMYLSACTVFLLGFILFENNTAENGGAMYLNHEARVNIYDGANIHFITNTATVNGGAIFVDLMCKSFDSNDYTSTFMYATSLNDRFINNSATIAGNAIYFNVQNFCYVNTNISDTHSILHVPCQFNLSQPVNGKMMRIPCDLDYTLLNGSGVPIATSPHELRLYFPFSDGYKISSPDLNVYFAKNNILGRQLKFTAAVFDHFGKPTEPTLFNIQLQCSHDDKCATYTLIGGNHEHIVTQSIDNFTILNVNFKGAKLNAVHINLTLALTSLPYSLHRINTTFVVELTPCIDHSGYTYSEDSQTCICYHANVKCSDDVNEIKRGYWFGSIASKATTSICPNHYCKITDRKQTSEGYFELPDDINAQCNHYRVGRACGECSLGYTLSYDSTNCISVHQCSAGWTTLVVLLTCLYWIAIVVGVFSLMYFKFQVSLGYLYGLVYYYSIVDILLDNNSYISDDEFQFISIPSSFAQLTPHFLGKLCFVKGLSGIDQLFIQFSHPVGVSLLLLLIVVAARCSARVSLFISRCIIRVICLLILLSYTSIASTSLQLLLPLRFTDVEELYTYSSPDIQYFHGRHTMYSIVAIICEVFVGIGLPLLLLFEPILSRKINFVKIKPLLDQFQGCYKDNYRWFAAYYLICRQVIFLVVYVFNSNYYSMLFYLQTACVVIAINHILIQPYKSNLLNALDGVMLLLIVLEVNIDTFPFLKNATIEISLTIVLLPLIVFITVLIKNIFRYCLQRWHHYQYDPINDFDDERVDDIVIRYVHKGICTVCLLLINYYVIEMHIALTIDHQGNVNEEPLKKFSIKQLFM